MTQHAPVPGLTENVQVPCLFVTGMAVETTRHIVRFVGWVLLPNLGSDPDENRLCVRFVMARDVAAKLRDDLDAIL